jgi:PAS domain S-box-containing protein
LKKPRVTEPGKQGRAQDKPLAKTLCRYFCIDPQLAEFALGLIYKASPDNYLTPRFVSPQIETLLGFTPQDFQTDPQLWEKQLHSGDREKVLAKMEHCRATGEPFVDEYRLLTQDGRVVWVYDTTWLVRDPEGKPLFLQGIMQDITQRREAEAALFEEKEKYRTLVDENPLGIAIIGNDGRYKYLNPKFVEIFGYTLDDLPTGFEWFAKAYPDAAYRSQVISDWKIYLQESQVGEAKPRTFTVACKDGAKKVINFRTISLGLMGGDQCILYEDISERRKVEEALKQSELRYRTLVEQIPAITYTATLDETSTTTYVSPQVETILGFTPSDYEADPNIWVKRIHPDDRNRVLAEIARCHSTGEPFAAEYRMVGRDGRTIWFRDEARPLCDPAGHPLFLQGVMLDITEPKQAEQALKESEKKYRLLVSQIPAIVLRIYPDWSIDCFDRKIQAFTGYPKEDFDSRRLKWIDLIAEDDLPQMKRVLQEALRGERSYVQEYRIRKKSGEYAWVQCRGQIYCDAEGKGDYISAVIFDITEKKQVEATLCASEERYRLMAENVSDVIWTTNMDLQISYISPSIQKLLGFTPEEIRGRAIGEIFLPASLGQALEVFSEEMAKERQGSGDWARSRMFELEQHHKDGSTVWTEIKASFIRDSLNQPVGILGVTRDITKRKQVEEDLRRREAILKAVSFAAEQSLREPDWENHIQEILGRLGEALNVGRVYIFENLQGRNGALLTSNRYEWVAPDITPQIDNPLHQGNSYRAYCFGRWEEVLSRGGVISGSLEEFPPAEQEIMAGQGIKALVAVPIFVDQEWWGFIGFDEYRRMRSWSSSEVDALLTSANTLGAAIFNTRSEKALKESEERLRSLSNKLLHAQENERQRLATELHNELGHDLLLLKLKLESLGEKLAPEQTSLRKEVLELILFIQDLIRNVRRFCMDLSPGEIEDLGLTASLHLLTEDFSRTMRLGWKIELDNLDDLFDMPLQATIYRMVQEVLTNIGKHSRAKNVSFRAKRAGTKVSFVIKDDGKGFNVAKALSAKKTLGLLAMEEWVRILGGTCDIVSQKNEGTKVSFVIPFHKEGN